MKIAIFGTGYVGLVTGACLAETGNSVVCLDIDKTKIGKLKKGEIPIYEPGLEDLAERNTRDKRLLFSSDLKKGVKENSILMIAVGTPSLKNGQADLSAVFSVAKTIGREMDEPKVIVQKSTVPVGTGEKVENIIAKELKKRKKEIGFEVASNPEFLKEGSAIEDFLKPERIIVGCQNGKAFSVLKKVYAPFMRKGYRVICMSRPSAELTKYAANSMLAARISFINSLARLAEEVGADIFSVREGIGTDSRIGKDFLFPSIGFGGSCFPKDVRALINTTKKYGQDNSILKSVYDVNVSQKKWFFQKIKRHFSGNLENKKIAVWGLAFKAQTDDVRESAALYFVDEFFRKGAKVTAFDPEAMGNFKKEIANKKIVCAKNQYEALKGADALLILTEWMQFRNPDFERMKKLMKTPVIFDGRNLYDPISMEEAGFKYFCIGRK